MSLFKNMVGSFVSGGLMSCLALSFKIEELQKKHDTLQKKHDTTSVFIFDSVGSSTNVLKYKWFDHNGLPTIFYFTREKSDPDFQSVPKKINLDFWKLQKWNVKAPSLGGGSETTGLYNIS
jgi:hypothetical protein